MQFATLEQPDLVPQSRIIRAEWRSARSSGNGWCGGGNGWCDGGNGWCGGGNGWCDGAYVISSYSAKAQELIYLSIL